MENNLILSPISVNDLLSQLRAIVREEIAAESSKQEEQLISTKVACTLFSPSISEKTLFNWTKQGLIPSHRIGAKVLYKKSEILNSLTTLKKFKVRKLLTQ